MTDFGSALRKRSLRWKASWIVGARALHGARARSNLGFVDESAISKGRLISGGSTETSETRMPCTRREEDNASSLCTTPVSARTRVMKRAAAQEFTPKRATASRWAANERARCPIAREAEDLLENQKRHWVLAPERTMAETSRTHLFRSMVDRRKAIKCEAR